MTDDFDAAEWLARAEAYGYEITLSPGWVLADVSRLVVARKAPLTRDSSLPRSLGVCR